MRIISVLERLKNLLVICASINGQKTFHILHDKHSGSGFIHYPHKFQHKCSALICQSFSLA